MHDIARTWVELAQSAIDATYRANAMAENACQVWIQQMGSVGRSLGDQAPALRLAVADANAAKRLDELYQEGLSQLVDTARRAQALNGAFQAWQRRWTMELITLYAEQASANFAKFQQVFSAPAKAAEVFDVPAATARTQLAA
jgi:hypothetical protein